MKTQTGAALLVALFVVALVAAAATLMIERLQLDTHRTSLILNANTGNLYAQGSIAWAMDLLNNDWKNQQNNRVIDKTPTSSTDKKNGFIIVGTLTDAQGLFNINNLSNEQYQTNFTRLIRIVSPDTDPVIAENITQAVIDWISPGSKNTEFDDFYQKLIPAYRAAHQPMASISELRLVKNVTPDIFNKLAPYLTALPEVTPININNSSPPILMSLSLTLTADAAKAVIQAAQQNPFSSAQQFINFDIIKNNPIDATKITVVSHYFLLHTNVTVGQQKILLNTLLQRSTKESQSTTQIIWQSKGTL